MHIGCILDADKFNMSRKKLHAHKRYKQNHNFLISLYYRWFYDLGSQSVCKERLTLFISFICITRTIIWNPSTVILAFHNYHLLSKIIIAYKTPFINELFFKTYLRLCKIKVLSHWLYSPLRSVNICIRALIIALGIYYDIYLFFLFALF